MGKSTLGLLAGLGLGLLDGASAVFNPDAQSMLTTIVVSATIKGGITGIVVALAARRLSGVLQNVSSGAVIGLVLSAIAAIPSGSYVEIIVPGVIVGMLVGLIVTKFGR